MERIHLPPDICRGCFNRYSDRCLSECSPAEDLHLFSPKDISFSDLPPFPTDEEWNKIESGRKMAIVRQHVETMRKTIEKIIDATGVEINGWDTKTIHRKRGVRDITDFRSASLQSNQTETATIYSSERTESSDNGSGFNQVHPEPAE